MTSKLEGHACQVDQHDALTTECSLVTKLLHLEFTELPPSMMYTLARTKKNVNDRLSRIFPGLGDRKYHHLIANQRAHVS